MTYTVAMEAEQVAHRIAGECQCTIWGGKQDYPCHYCQVLANELDKRNQQVADH